MKHKLINKQTGEEHLCKKVVIDGWDYYVSDELPQKNDKILCDERNHITENPKYKIRTCKSIVNDWIMTFEIDGQGENPNWTKKIIATNNPIIDIPKVVDETWIFFKEVFGFFTEEPIGTCEKDQYEHWLYKSGYNKSQETHPYSDNDMIEFGNWLSKEYNISNGIGWWHSHESIEDISTKELLQLWKEQRPKTLYYE